MNPVLHAMRDENAQNFKNGVADAICGPINTAIENLLGICYETAEMYPHMLRICYKTAARSLTNACASNMQWICFQCFNCLHAIPFCMQCTRPKY